MGSYPRQTNVCHAPKKKITVSFTIRDEEEKYHRSGVNSLQHDANLHRLYSAGRDSIIRIWDVTPDNQLSSHRVSSADSLRSHHRHRHHANGTNIIDNNNGSYDSRHNNHNSINNNHATTSSNIRRTNVKDYYIKSMEHHTDWVNDIILCRNGQNLISVSSDTTIKVWNAHSGFCLSTLRSHRDYVKCLAYAQDKEYVASACFEGVIYLWDVMTLTSLTSVKSTVTTKTLEGCKNSIYSLATNPAGTLVASGSTEKVIRLWDPRTRQKLLKLRGHSDNVRTLLLSPDGTQLVSGSSDGTVRLWSIGQQRCIATLRCHEEGVWSVSCNSSFDTIYSGGKDRRIYATHVNNSTNSVLVCQESAPILRLLHESTKDTLWAATTDSCLRNWSVRHANEHLINGGAPLNGGGSPQSSPSSSSSYSSSLYGQPDNHMTNVIPTTSEDSKHSSMNGLDQSCNYQRQHQQNSRRHPHQHPKPQRTIPGNPSIVSYHVLNDRRHILTRASDNSMALYDVLSAEKIEDIVASVADPDVAIEHEIKQRFRMVYVPNWFTVDLKTGMLEIHLDENECTQSWASAREYGFQVHTDTSQDPKINMGCLLLQALFEHWPPTYASDCDSYDSTSTHDHHQSATNTSNSNAGVQQRIGNQYFSVPGHTPVVISEANQTLLRFVAQDACGENEDAILQDIVPQWIVDIVIARKVQPFNKIPFFLLPHADSGIKSLRKERLSASDMLQVRKVIEHVCEKMLSTDDSTPTNAGSSASSTAAVTTSTGHTGQQQESTGTGSTGSAANHPIQQSNRYSYNDQQQHSTTTTPAPAPTPPTSAASSGKSVSPVDTSPEARVQLLCNDKVLPVNMDLRTVKHFIWKSSGDLVLYYMPIR